MNTEAPRRLRHPGRTLASAAVTLGAAVAVTVPAPALARPGTALSTGHTVLAETVSGYGIVLTNAVGRSLYVLSAESTGKIHCTKASGCTSIWPPLTVVAGARITGGPGVKGKLGHILRSGRWQVTFNGWPVYRYAGDTGPRQSHGERIVSFGGTWYLVRAAATTHSGTPVKSKTSSSSGSTTTTTWAGGSTTTTTWAH